VATVLTTLIGLIGGFLLSALFWYITVHVISPQIVYAEDISKIIDATGRDVYRVKIRNPSKRRGIIDISVRVSVRFPANSLRAGARAGNIVSFSLNVENPNIWRLAPGKSQVIDIDFINSLLKKSAQDIIATLYPVKDQRADLTLEALLHRGAGSYVRASLLCYDEWSGARKYFESKKYIADDIKTGFFSGMSVASTNTTGKRLEQLPGINVEASHSQANAATLSDPPPVKSVRWYRRLKRWSAAHPGKAATLVVAIGAVVTAAVVPRRGFPAGAGASGDRDFAQTFDRPC